MRRSEKMVNVKGFRAEYKQEAKVYEVMEKLRTSLEEFTQILGTYTVEELNESDREFTDITHFLELEATQYADNKEEKEITEYLTDLVVKNRINRRGIKDTLEIKTNLYGQTKNLLENIEKMQKRYDKRRYMLRTFIGADILINIDKKRKGEPIKEIYTEDFTRRTYDVEPLEKLQNLLKEETQYVKPNREYKPFSVEAETITSDEKYTTIFKNSKQIANSLNLDS